jgi:hypothetical protein
MKIKSHIKLFVGALFFALGFPVLLASKLPDPSPMTSCLQEVAIPSCTSATLEPTSLGSWWLKRVPLTTLTQTEAYLSVPELRSLVEETYNYYAPNALEINKSLIEQVIDQEVNLFEDYYVFYHGQLKNFILLYDIIKEIDAWLKDHQTDSPFIHLRTPDKIYDISQEKLTAILWKYLAGGVTTDMQYPLSHLLLSANLSLFGATGSMNWSFRNFFVMPKISWVLRLIATLQSALSWDPRSSSSSFYYFLASSNITHPCDTLLKEFFKNWHFDTSYIEQAKELFKPVANSTKNGNLLQIFVPKDKVNEYVYLSYPLGQPVHTVTIKNGQRPGHYRINHLFSKLANMAELQDSTIPALTIREFLDLYKKEPQTIVDIDFIQARIGINQDFLLNPESGIKIYSYNSADPQLFADYQKNLKTLISKMMLEWLCTEEKYA